MEFFIFFANPAQQYLAPGIYADVLQPVNPVPTQTNEPPRANSALWIFNFSRHVVE